MKKIIGLLLLPAISWGQANTEIHLFDITSKNGKFEVVNGKNISNNEGYDSQPHFYNDNLVLFASSRNGQTDIAKYTIENDKLYYISNTPQGGEYSPQKIPNSKNVSAVRLDNDGKQRFYEYDFKTGKNIELIKDVVVAYPMWYDKNTVISSAIVNDSLHLFISDLKRKTNTLITKEVGRSFHKIPNSNLVSFMKKNGKDWEVWSLNPTSKEIKFITKTGSVQDICWLPNGSILIPDKNAIYQFNPTKDKNWSLFHRFKDENINNISRITVNSNSTKLAITAEVSPRLLAEEQLQGYNNRDIEAFLKPYAKNVKVYTFPNKLNYEGVDEMRKRYASFFERTPDLHCKIVSRIVKGNRVIDEELVTVNGNSFKAVAIYEITNGKISSVYFLR
ncbi:nuclear transport factor 2 family protein [Tenacibaculum sp. MEBiC06402]|uniref:nuclear transport factor 2 family protein n=1 Tax=unclassified Tenacibaculum TaxID=2635139 RepID=UPI003B9BB91E